MAEPSMGLTVRESLNPDCEDAAGDAAWSCIESDGTGLWCESCLAVAATSATDLPGGTATADDHPIGPALS